MGEHFHCFGNICIQSLTDYSHPLNEHWEVVYSNASLSGVFAYVVLEMRIGVLAFKMSG